MSHRASCSGCLEPHAAGTCRPGFRRSGCERQYPCRSPRSPALRLEQTRRAATLRSFAATLLSVDVRTTIAQAQSSKASSVRLSDIADLRASSLLEHGHLTDQTRFSNLRFRLDRLDMSDHWGQSMAIQPSDGTIESGCEDRRLGRLEDEISKSVSANDDTNGSEPGSVGHSVAAVAPAPTLTQMIRYDGTIYAHEFCRVTGIKPNTLRMSRSRGKGPRAKRISNNRVVLSLRDAAAWLQSTGRYSAAIRLAE